MPLNLQLELSLAWPLLPVPLSCHAGVQYSLYSIESVTGFNRWCQSGREEGGMGGEGVGGGSERGLEVDRVSVHTFISSDIQGVQEKLCFFTIHCNPSLAYIAVIRKPMPLKTAVTSTFIRMSTIYNC